MAGKLKRPDVFRQSLLQGFTVCARRTRAAIEVGDDATTGWVESSGHLGTAMHAFAAEYLRTLYRQGEQQMATQEAVEVMYEVLAALPFALPFADLDALRGMVLNFCDYRWDPKRIMALEERLETEIACPDGEIRTLKGQPDILLADPPHGIVVEDLKSGRGKPKAPRQAPAEGEVIEGRQYLSDRGHFQGDVYSLLALRRYPTARYVIFRERLLRSGEVREARLSREELEHVERQVALTMMLLDRAISEGPGSELWKPRPGKHCATQCPVARSCPIPEEMRGDGAIETVERADEVASLYVVSNAQYTQAAKQLKAWEEGGNRPGRANEREEIRWDPPGSVTTKGGGRKFGLHPRVDMTMVEEGSNG